MVRARGKEIAPFFSSSPHPLVVTELALPEGGVSLEGSQLGDSQTALEIGGRHLGRR